MFTTIALVVGGVIGSGIFRKPGIMAAQVGSPGLLLAVWLLAGVMTLLGALTNAEIASTIPETGGQYVYFDRMYGPFVAFMYGWAIFIVVQTGSIAAIAYVFAEYAGEFVKLPNLPQGLATFAFHIPILGDIAPFEEFGYKSLAAVLILGLTAVNYVGVRFGGLVQNLSTVAKVGAMAALVAGAFLLPAGGNVANLTTPSPTFHLQGLGLLAGFAAALQGAFWAYDGWNKITYIAGEIKEPQRTIPLALGYGMLAVTGIYLAINIAYAYVLPIDAMMNSKLVAADVAERLFTGGARWIAVAVMLSTFGIANAAILATARVFFSMAQADVFPRFMGRSHARFRTPAASLVVQAFWTVALLFSGTFDTLTDTLVFVSWVFYAAGAFGVFVLRRKEPATPRPYRVPGYPFTPALFVLFALAYLVLTVWNDITLYDAARAAGKPATINSLVGTALVLAGTPLYFWFRNRARRRAS